MQTLPSELPVAHAVNDDMLPQAFVLDDDAQNLNENIESKGAHGRRCSRSTLLIFAMLIASIIILLIGLTLGFKPQPGDEQPTKNDNTTNGDEPPR